MFHFICELGLLGADKSNHSKYWDAKGTGTEMRYSFKDLVVFHVARELHQAGISTQSLRAAISRRAELSESGNGNAHSGHKLNRGVGRSLPTNHGRAQGSWANHVRVHAGFPTGRCGHQRRGQEPPRRLNTMAQIPEVPKDQFEAAIKALLNAPPTPMADIPRKRAPSGRSRSTA